jgi:predicted nucleic acid-binding protein
VVRLHDSSKLEHAKAVELWEEWLVERVAIVAPFLLRYEVTNAAYRSVRSGEISERAGRLVVAALEHLPIRYVDTFEMHLEAFEFARRFDAKTSYDGHYVSLARREGVPLITADKKLVNAAQFHNPFVRFVMDE